MELSELLQDIRARCPNNYLHTSDDCERLIMEYATPRIIRKKLKSNEEIKKYILGAIDCLLMDGGLSDEDDEVLKEAAELIEGVEVE
jgi:hypothetical protein